MADNFNISDQPGSGGAGVDSFNTRTGVVVAAASDYDASQVDNDSGVAGAFVSDALDNNAAAAAAAALTPVPPVDSVFARTGNVVAAASDYDASQVDNDSNVPGSFVADALNNLRHAACQARRTTDVSLGTSFADITLDTTDVEIAPAIIEHDNTDTDRLNLLVAGTYEIHYHFQIDPPTGGDENAFTEARVTVNDGGAALPGSETGTSTIEDGSIEGDDFWNSLSATFYYVAAANDFITLQAQFTDTGGGADSTLAGGTIVLSAKRVT